LLNNKGGKGYGEVAGEKKKIFGIRNGGVLRMPRKVKKRRIKS